MKSRRGAYAVEFALTLPVLLILVTGMIDVGRQLSYSDAVATAVAEGARAGALADPTTGEDPIAVANTVTTFVWDKMETGSTLTVTSTVEGASPNLRLRVVGTASHGVLFGFVSLPISTSYNHVVRLDRQ